MKSFLELRLRQEEGHCLVRSQSVQLEGRAVKEKDSDF
jgi:hypothetical protein